MKRENFFLRENRLRDWLPTDVSEERATALVERIAKYFLLCESPYLNADLAKTLLASLENDEIIETLKAHPDVASGALEKLALAACRWAIELREISIPDVLRAVPILRSMIHPTFWNANTWILDGAEEQAFEAMRRFREARQNAEHEAYWNYDAKRAILSRFAVEAMVKGEVEALENFLSTIVEIGSFFPYDLEPSEISSVLVGARWRTALGREGIGKIYRKLEKLSPTFTALSLRHIMLLVGFTSQGELNWMRLLNDDLIMPLARSLFAHGLIEPAYTAVHWALLFFGYRLSEEREFDAWVKQYASDACDAGRRLTSSRRAEVEHKTARPTKVVFFTRGGSIEAAALNHLLIVLSYLAGKRYGEFEISLHVLQEYSRELDLACEANGIRVVFYADYGGNPESVTPRLIRAKQKLEEEGVDIAVWTHAFDLPFLLFGMRVAPIQVLFSQYLHPDTQGLEIDERITWGSPVLNRQVFNGREWRVIPSALNLGEKPIDSQSVESIRRSLGTEHGKIIAGTLTRAEKIVQSEFMECLIALLQRHPKLVFVWTGQWKLELVVERFRAAGVLHQTHFVGWVDVSVYCRVLDIMLDTFPLSNGITAIHAMQAGTPILSSDSDLSYAGRDIMPAVGNVWAGPSAYRRLAGEISNLVGGGTGAEIPIARNERDYVELASRLIDDVDFRTALGRTWKAIYELVYADEALMAERFHECLVDIWHRHNSKTKSVDDMRDNLSKPLDGA